MRKVRYTSEESFYVAGRDVEDARRRSDTKQADNPLDAWNQLGYFEREGEPDAYEVFEFHVSEIATKVEPPYNDGKGW